MAFSDLLATADRIVLAHLGGPVRYRPQVGAAVDVTGIFDQAYQLATTGSAGGPGVESSRPAVWLLLADLPTDPDQDEPIITVGGVSYTVRERQRDGRGGVVLMLQEA